MSLDFADPRRRLIVALDVDDPAEARRIADLVQPAAGFVKIGLQLFTIAGPELVRQLAGQGHGIFLDLKFHDIPNTVLSAAKAAAGMGVSLFTVHCLNGSRALVACRRELDAHCQANRLAAPEMVGVTVLTSLLPSDLSGCGIIGGPSREAEILAGGAYRAGLRTFVASAQEAALLKAAFPGIAVITPGIRPAEAARDDQARVDTPAGAIRAGADALVVGRPIVRASDPALAARQILDEIRAAAS